MVYATSLLDKKLQSYTLTQVNDLIDIGITLIQLEVDYEALLFYVDLFPKISEEAIKNYYISYGIDSDEDRWLLEPYMAVLRDALYKSGKWGTDLKDYL